MAGEGLTVGLPDAPLQAKRGEPPYQRVGLWTAERIQCKQELLRCVLPMSCPSCQVVVPSDLSELLTTDTGMHAASFELALPSSDSPPTEKLHQFRMLILSGRKKVVFFL